MMEFDNYYEEILYTEENKWYIVLNNVKEDNIDVILQQWVENNLDGYSIQWVDICILFCRFKCNIENVDNTTMIFFDKTTNATNLSLQPSDDDLYSYLLFIHYDISLSRIYILGNLSHTEFQELIKNCGYLVISDLNTYFITNEKTESQSISIITSIPYYHNEYSNTFGILDTNNILAADTLYQNTVSKIIRKNIALQKCPSEMCCLTCSSPSGHMNSSSLKNENMEIDPNYMSIAFDYNIILAASNPSYKELFYASERKKLIKQLDDLECQTESVWDQFITKWFPRSKTTMVNSIGKYQHENRASMDQRFKKMTESNKISSIGIYNQIKNFYKKHYPNEHIPSLFFRTSIVYLPEFIISDLCPICNSSECDVMLPNEDGFVVFTRKESKNFVLNYFDSQFQQKINQIQSVCGTNFASSIWSKIKKINNLSTNTTHFNGKDINTIVKNFTKKIYNQNFDYHRYHLVYNILEKLHKFDFMSLQFCKGSNILSFVLEFIDEIDLSFEKQEYGINSSLSLFGNRQHNNLNLNNENNKIIRYANIKDPLNTYAQVMIHIKTFWPLCMINLSKCMISTSHPKHAERLKLCSFIRLAGYSQENAMKIWYNIFLVSDINKNNSLDENTFFNSKQGKQILYAYASIKTQGLGISCMNLIKKSMCPYSDRTKITTMTMDIEDITTTCKTSCTNSLKKKLNNTRINYNIYNPYNYTKTAIKFK